MNQQSTTLTGISPEFFYRLNEIFFQAVSWRTVIEQILLMSRPAFIFDNVVVFLGDPQTGGLDVAYAKATGRGKSAEADVAWGEILANQVVEKKCTILQEPDQDQETDRLQRPYSLGIPLQVDRKNHGVIIFIRFGGPQYTSHDRSFAEYLSYQIAQMIARESLKKENERLEFQYRVFQVQEDFISTLSHELRNPLGFIKGYTTTLLRPDANWDMDIQKEFLSIIDRETDRLQELIENLLDSARLQSGHIVMNFQTVRLDALMNDITARSRLHHPDLVIKTSLDTPLKSIQADPRRLAQIFENIINNVVKYAPGSPVIITIKNAENGLDISIQDLGPGIPEKYVNKIFDRFFRVPDQRTAAHGSGLGLFICKQIIQAHNGEIQAVSKPGEGTTFLIHLNDQP